MKTILIVFGVLAVISTLVILSCMKVAGDYSEAERRRERTTDELSNM